MVVQGGKCWFGVESKSFELLKELVKGKEIWLDCREGTQFLLSD